MKYNNAEIYVFSGSGNTFLLAEAVADILRENNCPTTLRWLSDGFIPAELPSVLGLAIPVAWFATYPFIIDFLHNLPPGEGREVFLLGSMAAASGGMQEPIRKLLVKKHYRPIGFRILPMPSNYNKNSDPNSIANRNMIKTATSQAANFAGQLLTGKSSWTQSFAPISGFFHAFAQGDKPWYLFRKLFPLQIKPKQCIKCGRCQSICPSHAISADSTGDFQIDVAVCVSCQHCSAFCPQKAIGTYSAHTGPYRAIEYDELQKKLNAPN